MKTKQLEIVYLPPNQLTPYEKNARKHGDVDIDGIIKSIKDTGFNDPIGIWGEKNIIVEGHGRQMAAIKMGMETVPCIRLDHLTDEQRREYTIRHNRSAEMSGWDFDVLQEELAALDIQGIDMSDLNFDFHIDEEPAEVKEDDYDASGVPTEPRAKLGDIYQLGEHRLMCGDATSENDIDKLLEGNKATLALTDPPYGINVVKQEQVGGGGATHFGGKIGGENIVPSSTYVPIIGDESTDAARDNYALLTIHSENQILFGGNYFTDFLNPSRCWIVWDKQNTGNFADAELAWTSFDKGVKLYQWMWNGLARKGEKAVEGVHRVHPTQKPVGLMGEILKDFSQDGDSILDCFGGSGTTLIACEQTNRKCYMMELSPAYVDIIIDRWEKLTGKKAVLING